MLSFRMKNIKYILTFFEIRGTITLMNKENNEKVQECIIIDDDTNACDSASESLSSLSDINIQSSDISCGNTELVNNLDTSSAPIKDTADDTFLDTAKKYEGNQARHVKSLHTGSDKIHLGYFKNVLIPVALYSTIVGIIVGVLVGLYNKFSSLISHWSVDIYTLVRDNPAYVPLLLFGVAIIAILAYLLLKLTPECKGSGVPRTEGVLRGLLTFRWLRVLLTTISSSILSYFGGLSLGAEGPSIQIGATTAQGVSELLKCRMAWTSYIMSAGAGTGLAVAFNAPLTGIVFILEEVHRRTTPMIMLTAGCSVMTGTIVSRALSLLWGASPNDLLFGFESSPATFALTDIWMLVVLGIAIGLLAVGFNWMILNSQKLLNKFVKVPALAKIMTAFLVSAAVGLAWPATLGGGHDLILTVGARDTFAWDALLILFVVKLGLIILSFNSGATGGLFVPMLSIGAIMGALFGEAFLLAGLDPALYNIIVIISMSALFGACVKTPITAMILVLEVTGAFHSFLFTGLTVMIAYFVVEIFRSPALYDALLESNLNSDNQGKEHEIIEFDVEIVGKSFADHKEIRDLLWPPKCIVESIHRSGLIIIPASDTILYESDILTIKVDTYTPDKTQEYIEQLLNE